MRIGQANVQAFRISGVPSLDPITVVLQDFGKERGQLIIECFGCAWSAYWGAMGERTLAEFVSTCSTEYIANKLWDCNQRRTKDRYAYLNRIVKAVQEALQQTTDQRSPEPPTVGAKPGAGAGRVTKNARGDMPAPQPGGALNEDQRWIASLMLHLENNWRSIDEGPIARAREYLMRQQGCPDCGAWECDACCKARIAEERSTK